MTRGEYLLLVLMFEESKASLSGYSVTNAAWNNSKTMPKQENVLIVSLLCIRVPTPENSSYL